MGVKVIFFGQLSDVTGRSTLEIEDVADTSGLRDRIHDRFPALASTTYRIAVEKKIVTENTALKGETTVALLPPFSGG
jgi:molybdopterin synthase sulfur carrier subunit